MKNQKYLIEVGDRVLYRANVPIRQGCGFVHDKDYIATVIRHHPIDGTDVEFIGDDGSLKKKSVEYNSFKSGMSICKLILEPNELRRRQHGMLQEWLLKAEEDYLAKIARIRSAFNE